MDMSEESQEAESEPELPPAEAAPPPKVSRHDRRGSDDSLRREKHRDRDSPRPREPREPREGDRRERRRDSPPRAKTDRRDARRDDRHRCERGDKIDRGERVHKEERGRRGLLGDQPDDRSYDSRPPALMELKPFGGDPPSYDHKRSHDARDAVSPRFVDREKRSRDRERERDRDRHSRRSEERRSSHRRGEPRSRSRSRGAVYPPHHSSGSSSSERRVSPPSNDYRPTTSYKVSRKLDVMEKMGLQIKTPDGSMATAQQLRAAAGDAPLGALPSYCAPGAFNATKILDQKRKLLWSHKGKSEAEEAAKWSGTRFAQDNDGRQVSKFMRLMGIKEPGAINTETAENTVDPIKKQEELFQAMQAQYEVARATTHTMRGVGLGFQRGQF